MRQMRMERAIENRNRSWNGHPLVPSWVDIHNVDLDQFFTRPEIAEHCVKSLHDWMVQDGAQTERYTYIEPAAGGCAFYNLLPESRRIGIDVLPLQDDLIEKDFLSWRPQAMGKYAVIGNPPFGYRAWLALAFINHAATFADYVGLILPMAFQSDGKGSPKLRVRGLRLIHTEYLRQDSFTDIYGRSAKVNALWQVWQRGVNNITPLKPCDTWIDLFTVDMRKERLCGQERLGEADYFLQRTFYKEPPSLVRDFSQVRYVCGYGIVLKKEKERIINLLNSADWTRYSNLAAHNCHHISMYHIRKVLTDAGYVDA